MTKKSFYKIYMAIIALIVILFASRSYAGYENPNDLATFVANEFTTVFDAWGTSTSESYNGGNDAHSQKKVLIQIDQDTINRLRQENIYLYVRDDSPCNLCAQYRNGNEVGPVVNIKIKADGNQLYDVVNQKDIRNATNDSVISNEGEIDPQGKDSGKVEQIQGNYYGVPITDLGGKVLIFGPTSNQGGGSATIDNTHLAFLEGDSGTPILRNYNNQSTPIGEATGTVHQWYQSGQDVVNATTATLQSNGRYRYLFQIQQQVGGTFKITTSDNIIPAICYRDVLGNRVNMAPYALYNENGIFATADDRCYVLAPDDIYYIEVDEGTTVEFRRISNDTREMTGSWQASSNIDEDFFKKIERLLAEFILSIARVINWLIGVFSGRQITLDDIIFNKFSEIRLDFFKTDIFGNPTAEVSTLVTGYESADGSTKVIGLRDAVSTVYNFFKGLAIIGYLIILIYIGIKIILSSTTAKKKATYKETFTYWVTGIAILFFMPYYMKYTIALNEAIVKYISDDSGIRSDLSVTGSENAEQMNSDKNHGFLKTEFEDVLDYGRAQGKDYMTSIGHIAATYLKIGYSVAFLILTWQIVTLLVYYYKRIFVTAILIMVFPLIAFTFVWDKLNDGRSQALSAWTREFTITVFVQTFHAIVYVFITNTIYATIQRGPSGEPINADFVLLIIASSFLFVGEDILKRLFGGGGEALGSATQSAAKIAFITKGMIGMGTRTVKNVVSKDGLVRKSARSLKEAATYRYMAKAPRGVEKRADGTKPSRMELLANDQERHRGVGAYLPSEGEITPTIQEAGEMLYDLNNGNTPQDLSEALKKYHQLMDARNGVGLRTMTDYERKQFDEMMKRSGISATQIDRLDKAMENAAVATAAITGDRFSAGNRDKMRRISQNLRIEIEAIFPAVDREGNKLTGKDNIVADRMMNVATLSMVDGIHSTKQPKDFEREWSKRVEEVREISETIRFKTITSVDVNGSIERRNTLTQDIMTSYISTHPEMSEEKQRAAKNIAKQVASLKQTYSGDASKYQVVRAFQVIEQDDESKEMAKAMMEIAGIDSDIDTLKYLLMKKINTSGVGHGEEAGTLLNTSPSRTIDAFISERQDEIFNHYKNTVGAMSRAEEREAKLYALHLARVENYEIGLLDSSFLARAMITLGGNEELTNRMMQAAGIEGSYATYQRELSNLIDVEAWSTSVTHDIETGATTNRDESPYITIKDFAEAAEKGTVRGDSPTIGSARDMLNKATREGAHEEIVERKQEAYNRGERIRQQQLNEAASEFGLIARDIEGYSNKKSSKDRLSATERFMEKEALLDGLSRKDMQTIARQNALSGASGIAQMITDTLVTPVTTMAGFAIGAAVTDDFMPAEEALLGAIGGYKIGAKATEGVEVLTAEKERQEKLARIKKEANKRVKQDEEDRLTARQAFEDAAYEARDGLDGALVFTGANATMHLEADGSISATVNVMAQNAAFIHVSEDAPIPSGGWQAYQESIYYKFNDRNPTTPHTLFIYVRDRSGNVLGKKIDGIHL